VTKVDSPDGRDDWHQINSDRGAECALVAVRDEPLDAAGLERFERLSAYNRNENRVDEVFQIGFGSQELSRGLGAVVKSRKDPLNPEFEQDLKTTFAAFHGLVVPHQ